MADFPVYEVKYHLADFIEGVILELQNKNPIFNVWIGD